MPTQKDLKRLVRGRMKKTGESYTAARARLLEKKKTAGDASVVKSLDETVSRKAATYLPPTAPRGPADQLRAPELLEARK